MKNKIITIKNEIGFKSAVCLCIMIAIFVVVLIISFVVTVINAIPFFTGNFYGLSGFMFLFGLLYLLFTPIFTVIRIGYWLIGYPFWKDIPSGHWLSIQNSEYHYSIVVWSALAAIIIAGFLCIIFWQSKKRVKK